MREQLYQGSSWKVSDLRVALSRADESSGVATRGVVREGDFAKALELGGIFLARHELSELTRAFRREGGLVEYASLLEAIVPELGGARAAVVDEAFAALRERELAAAGSAAREPPPPPFASEREPRVRFAGQRAPLRAAPFDFGSTARDGRGEPCADDDSAVRSEVLLEAFRPERDPDVLAGRGLQRKRLCRTFSDCTTAPRNAMVSGCYPLDAHYKKSPQMAVLTRIKKAANLS